MNYSKFSITLDVHSTLSQVSIPVPQNDTARRLYVSLTDGGKPFYIEDGCRAVLAASKSDGTHLLNDCIVEKNQTIRYDFTEQTTAAIGKMDCAIKVYDGNNRLLTSPRFTIVVYEGTVPEVVLSEDEHTSIDRMLLDEEARVTAEAGRVAAENKRVSDEEARKKDYIAYKESVDSRVDSMGRVQVSNEEPTDEAVDLWINGENEEEIALLTNEDILQNPGNSENAVMSQRAVTKEIEALQEQFQKPIQEQVDNYLDRHPEATTTVQDGSLTEDKFTDDLKLAAIKDYVTPQMFGAKGDGVADDTVAIRYAVTNYDNVYFPNGIYSISDSIVIESDNKFYQTNGYLGKSIKGDNAKLIITTNKPCIIVRGYHNTISNLVCCFASNISEPTAALLELQSLSANDIKQCCNNVFDNIRCVSSLNIHDRLPTLHGIGIKIVSDGTSATYQNRFSNCICADLYKGLVIEDNSSEGVNSNSFGVDLWNCSYLFYGNGSGNTFNGHYQSAVKMDYEENVCFYMTGSFNTVTGFAWDCGAWGDESALNCPFLFVLGKNNVFTSPCLRSTCKGDLSANKILSFSTPFYNDTPYISNTPYSMLGSWGYPIVYPPIGNSLKYSGITMELETENVSMLAAPSSKYTEVSNKGIPTNIKPLTNDDIDGRALNFTCDDNAKIILKITLPAYSQIDAIYIYTTNNRLIPNNTSVYLSSVGFDSDTYREKTFDFTEAARAYLNCFNLKLEPEALANERYVKVVLDMPKGTFGLSYVSAIVTNDIHGLIVG